MAEFHVASGTVSAASRSHASARRRPQFLMLLAAVLALCGAASAQDANLARPGEAPPAEAQALAWRARHIPEKPAHTALDPARHENHVILVKFWNDLPIRLRDGALSDLGTGVLQNAQATLDQLAAGSWQRTAEISEDRIDAMRARAEAKLQREMADMNTYFHFFLADGMDAVQVIDALNALEVVELAQPVMKPAPLPVPPNFQSFQGYLNNATAGVGAAAAWNAIGTRGEGVTICDLEYLCNANHLDLDVQIIGPTPQNPPGQDMMANQNHGTAVLGEMGSLNNGWGTTGIASEAEYLFAGVYYNNSYQLSGALLTAANALEPGDIIVVEQQLDSGTGYVPVEWWMFYHDTITLIVGQGIIVVEAAGNGGQNLDVGVSAAGSHNHFPFTAQNDSGAIIVGAGAAPVSFGGSDVDRSRLDFSTYGSRVNVQGWGEAVFTTGYGNWYSAEGVNLYYAWGFGGTSAATPIVAGACALLQSAHVEQYGTPIDPWVLRDVLVETGSPQQAGSFPVSQHIGPRPNVIAAFDALVPPGDLNDDGVINEEDRAIFCGAMGAVLGQPAFVAGADLNNDDVIDHEDLEMFNVIVPPCHGDVVTTATLQLPADGVVNAADLAYMLSDWGQNATCADFAANSFDLTPDGFVNGADLAVLLGGWGTCK